MTDIVTFVAVFGAVALSYFAVGRLIIDRRERLPLSRLRAADIIHTIRRAVGVLRVRYLPADRFARGSGVDECAPPCPEGRSATPISGDPW